MYAPSADTLAQDSPKPRVSVEPTVAILLCTLNGENHLRAQLDSFDAQQHRNWRLWISDDGSQDRTPAVLDAYRQTQSPGRVSLLSGPGRGFVANFMAITCQADIDADFYAYADQDDVWETDKLNRAIAHLSQADTRIPALYCSRTRAIDRTGRSLGCSPLFPKPPGFANALVQNIGGGNTMVFNRAARDLLRKAGPKVHVVTHDWWAYLLISGCGGQVFYDPYPSVLYRQHGKNLTGANASWVARAIRVRMLWQGHFRQWSDLNLNALAQASHLLTNENKALLARFTAARRKKGLSRMIDLLASGVYRQTTLGTASLILAATLGRI